MKKIFKIMMALIMSFAFTMTIKANSEQPFIDNIRIENASGGEIGVDSHLKVIYEWSLKDHKKGDVIHITLPQEIAVPKELNFNLETSNGIEVGKVNVGLDRVVTITLDDPTDYIKTHKNIKGTLSFSVLFDKNHVNSAGDQDLVFSEDESEVHHVKVVVSENPNTGDNNTLITKWGDLNEEQGDIDWFIRVNEAKKTINNAYVLENLGVGQSVIKDSIKIYEVELKEGTTEIINQKDVTGSMKISDLTNTGFRVDFGNINKTYLIQFKSKIIDKNQVNYLNTASVKGDGGIDSSDNAREELFAGSGKVEGDNLYDVNIIKKDGDTKEVLPNVEFQLYDSNNNLLYDKLTTDVDGKINVGGLVKGVYYLKETKTNDGYELLKDPIKIVIDDNSPVTIDLEVDNFKEKLGSVELLKTDEDNQVLSNVEFELINLDDNSVVASNLLTNTEGKIVVNNLKKGNYAFKETKALEGYEINNKLIKFSITQDNIDESIKLTAINKKIPEVPVTPEKPTTGKVVISKVDAINGKELSNAKLEIKDESGKTVDSWTSTGETHEFEVEVDKVYTLTETTAPNGYEVAESISFYVDKSGKTYVSENGKWVSADKVVMKDARKLEVPTTPNQTIVKQPNKQEQVKPVQSTVEDKVNDNVVNNKEVIDTNDNSNNGLFMGLMVTALGLLVLLKRKEKAL